MTTTTSTVRIRPIPTIELNRLRRSGSDVSGSPIQLLDEAAGEPLRCCLRNAVAGEQVILFGYEPPLPGIASPYREIGPVIAHAHDCGGPSGSENPYPSDWYGRPQVLRAYDERGWIHPATTTHDGSDPETALAGILAQDGVVEVHSRNVAYGCFMFVATNI